MNKQYINLHILFERSRELDSGQARLDSAERARMTPNFSSRHLRTLSKNNQSGQALITLLFFMIIGVTLLTAASFVTLGNVSSTSSAEQGTIAYYNAEAGIEDALLQMLRYPKGSTTPYTGTNGTPIQFVINGVSYGSATVSANLTTGDIYSTGVYQSAQRTIKVKTANPDGLHVVSWQEIAHPW